MSVLPASDESTETSTTPSLGLLGDGLTRSALTEQSMSVADPGRCIREDPLERTSDDTVAGCDVLDDVFVLME